MSTIHIIGLGPGKPGQLTADARKLLWQGRPLYLRTCRHPLAGYLTDRGIPYRTFDYLYLSLIHILAVGFDLYCRLLEQAIADLKQEKREEPPPSPRIDLKVSAFIPSSYIISQDQKIDFYQRIYASHSEQELTAPVSYTHLDVYKRQDLNSG